MKACMRWCSPSPSSALPPTGSISFSCNGCCNGGNRRMAGLENSASLAAAQADISRDAARRLDVVFRSGAGIFSILVVLIAWELFARSGRVTAFMLPPFSAVVERIYADAVSGDLWINLGLTLARAMTGFAIAAAGGIALGALMARSRLLRWFFDPIISVGV